MDKVLTFPETSGRIANYLHYRQTGRVGSYPVKFIYSFIHLKYLLSAYHVPGTSEENKLEKKRLEGGSFTLPSDKGVEIKTQQKE